LYEYESAINNDGNILVNADMQRLTQVISNLLSNALKFTRSGTITITAVESKGNPEVVTVSVKDTGTGIDSEIFPKLFSKFVTRSYQGTGLGLYISKSIIEAHGGTMWAENNSCNDVQLKGSTFYFTMPVVRRSKHEQGGKVI
jgi:signal transduction histidine kinase